MSTCTTSTSATNCPCDDFVHPAPLVIDAGQAVLARQIAAFPEFRRAMLLAISEYGPLSGWAARKDEDLGVMLIEMWAYLCDVLTFYDQVIAQESYLRTANRRPSVRKLVDMLGYLPRPATAATAKIAAFASGRQPITLPKGTVFRSKAFDAEPPQVFELDAETLIHPFANQWTLKRAAYDTVGSTNPSSLTVIPSADLPAETLVLVANADDSTQNTATKVSAQTRIVGDDGIVYTQLTLLDATYLEADALLAKVGVYKPAFNAKLYAREDIDDSVIFEPYTFQVDLQLDRVYDQWTVGDNFILQIGSLLFAAQADAVMQAEVTASTGSSISINGSTFSMPGLTAPVTAIRIVNEDIYNTLNTTMDKSLVRVHFGLRLAASVVREPAKTLVAGDELDFTAAVEEPIGTFSPNAFLLEDKNTIGLALEGGWNANLNGLDVPDVSDWTDTLYAPVKAYGNVVNASRGESVTGEKLGSGNGSSTNQQFKLKKAPLTYFSSPTLDNDQGVASTLVLYVDNIMWTEVSSFYLMGPDDEVYTVRQDDNGDSWVTFGDGIKGRRLPSGTDNVIANYRYGAGAATPPAGGINQIGKPVAGLQSIANPVAAVPGSDAEAQEDIRSNAPQSILILGRAVSMKDMEAVALSVPGVRLAQAEWRWSATAQQPTAHIWYVGDAALKSTIELRLRSVTDPNTPFTIEVATARSILLTVDIAHDPSYEATALATALSDALNTEETGFLMPENLGIGQHFFRSQLFAALLSVPGTTNVQAVYWSEGGAASTTFDSYGKRQDAGSYWDFETYPPVITLNEDTL